MGFVSGGGEATIVGVTPIDDGSTVIDLSIRGTIPTGVTELLEHGGGHARIEIRLVESLAPFAGEDEVDHVLAAGQRAHMGRLNSTHAGSPFSCQSPVQLGPAGSSVPTM